MLCLFLGALPDFYEMMMMVYVLYVYFCVIVIIKPLIV